MVDSDKTQVNKMVLTIYIHMRIYTHIHYICICVYRSIYIKDLAKKHTKIVVLVV